MYVCIYTDLDHSDSPTADVEGTMVYDAASGTQAYETAADAHVSATSGGRGGQATLPYDSMPETLPYDSVPETQDESMSATMQYQPQQHGGVAASDCQILKSQL